MAITNPTMRSSMLLHTKQGFGISITTFLSAAPLVQACRLTGACSRPNAKEEAKTGYEIGNFREPDPRRFWTGTSTLALWRFVGARASIFGMPDRPWQSRGQFSLPLWCYPAVRSLERRHRPNVNLCLF